MGSARTCVLACAAATCLVMGERTAPGQAPPANTPGAPSAPDPKLARLIADLGAEDLDVRLAADEALRASTVTLTTLESLLKREPAPALTPEQRQRLLDIGWEHFRVEPRAAMGIRSNWNSGRGVTIDGLTPGFPACSILKPGDRIESADGVKLDQFNTLRMVILAHDPGEQMTLRVLRDGAVLNLAVPLGDFSKLPERLPDEYSLKEAWADHRARRALAAPRPDGPEPLASGVPLPIWARADEQAPEDEPAATLIQVGNAPNDERTSLVVGGEPRGGVAPPVLEATTGSRMRRLTPDLQGLQAVRIQADQARMTVQVLSEQRRMVDADVQASIRQLADPTIPESRKKGLREDLQQKQANLLMLDSEIKRYQSLINRR
jgi:hypothetical protein